MSSGAHRSAIALGAVATAAAAFAAPASAVIATPPANGHGILVFPVRDFITGNGYTPGSSVTVRVLRNGVIIGSAVAATGADGSVLVNHPANPADPQNCWGNTAANQPSTPANRIPDIMGGDVVQILTGAGAGDQVTTQNVVVTSAAANSAGTIVVQGTATDPAGRPLPAASVQQRLISKNNPFDRNGRRDLRAPGDGTFTYPDSAGPTHWTATYTGLSAADQTRAVNSETRMLWLGANPLLVNDLTLYEFGQIPGPAAPCQGTLARTALTTTDRATVNAANAGTPLTVGGVADSPITRVAVSVPGRAAIAATLAKAPSGQQTWTAAVPAADLAAQPDGAFAVTATFTGPGAPGPDTATIAKDTVAPAAPTAVPGPGRYATAQAVTLAGEGGATIRYTNDGAVPVPEGLAFMAPIGITATQTITARAFDAAGNASAPAAFAYTIGPAPAALAVAGARAGGPAVGRLRIQSVLRRAVVRRRGVALSFDAPRGATAVRVQVLRIRPRPVRRLFSSLYRVRGGRHQVLRLTGPRLRARLTPGRYRIDITPRIGRHAFGRTTSRTIRITR